jgi:hypothetical protein
MKAFIAALAFLSMTGCGMTPRDDWSRANTVAEVAFQVSNALDAAQTAQFKDRPDVGESVPLTRALIGESPTTRDTAIYFATMGVSHYLIARMLPAKWRPWFQGGSLIYSSALVYNNCNVYGLLCGGRDGDAAK